MGILNPMIIFLRQEIHRIDRVLRTVRNSLNDLQLAIDGIIILNDVSGRTRGNMDRRELNFSLCDTFWIRFTMAGCQTIG